MSLQLSTTMEQLTENGARDGFILIGTGTESPPPALAELEAKTRSSVWNLSPIAFYYATRDSRELNRRSAERGIDSRAVNLPHGRRHDPLHTSYCATISTQLREGPVFLRMILVDEECAVLYGAPTANGEPTTWAATHPPIVELARTLWHSTWASSTPVLPEGQPPPFTPRQVEVAFLLVDGLTDQAIARRLGVSPRTVATEIARISSVLGVSGRAQAAAALAGVAAS